MDLIENLKMSYRQKLKKRKDQESTYWIDPPDHFITDLQHTSSD